MKTFLQTWRIFRGYLRAKHIRLYPAFLVGLSAALLSLLVPWFSKFFIDEILINQEMSYAIPFLLFWFLFDILQSIGFRLRSLHSTNAVESINAGASIVILKKLHMASKAIFGKYESGNLISYIRDIERNNDICMNLANEVVEICVYLVAMPLVFLIIDPILAMVVGITVLGCVLTVAILSRLIEKLHRKQRYEESTYVEHILRTMEHTPLIRSLGIQGTLFRELFDQSSYIKELTLKKSMVSTSSKATNRIIFSAGTFLYRLFSVYLVSEGRMTLGDFFAYNVVLSLLFSPIELLSSLVRPTLEMVVQQQRLNELFQFPDQKQGVVPLPEQGILQMNNVTFIYPLQTKPAVRSFSYLFKPGILYGMVGSNGTGKSTLLQLMARHFDITEGSITFGNVPITEIQRDQYHRGVVYLPPAGYLFPTSLERNIAPSKILDQQRFGEIIADFEISSLATHFGSTGASMLGDKSVDLSMGETQKVTLARAVYFPHKIYLFDEAFASLDHTFQQKIAPLMRKYLSKAIIIIASHNMAFIKELDEILFIKEGKLVEVKTPAQIF